MVWNDDFFLLLQIENKIVSIYIIISEKMVIDFEKIAEAHLEGFKGVRQGQVHYCPMNHAHYMENLTDHDLVYLAIVPEHH